VNNKHVPCTITLNVHVVVTSAQDAFQSLVASKLISPPPTPRPTFMIPAGADGVPCPCNPSLAPLRPPGVRLSWTSARWSATGTTTKSLAAPTRATLLP
jgi:hypothetical protein